MQFYKRLSRVVRGGSWLNPQDDCRAAYRLSLNPVNRRSGFIGFRLVGVEDGEF